MRFINYVVLNDDQHQHQHQHQRVTREECDPAEQAGIIDRTLLPVLHTGQGWADNRKSGYTVAGEIKSSTSKFTLHDEGVPIATLGVCLKAKASSGLWTWLQAHGSSFSQTSMAVPTVPWAALLYDEAGAVQPPWIHWWAKHVAFALLTREGW